LFEIVGYDLPLNGYSLIPSWWRDRPYETQQPANEKKRILVESAISCKGAKPEARLVLER